MNVEMIENNKRVYENNTIKRKDEATLVYALLVLGLILACLLMPGMCQAAGGQQRGRVLETGTLHDEGGRSRA